MPTPETQSALAQPATLSDVQKLLEAFSSGLELFFVKREEHNHLLQEVASLQAQLRAKGQQLVKDVCGSGKYQGMLRSQIIETDPEYVIWLADNNTGQRVGFTEAETAQARLRVEAKGEKRSPQQKRFTAPEFKAPSKGGSGFDDYDDDIPF